MQSVSEFAAMGLMRMQLLLSVMDFSHSSFTFGSTMVSQVSAGLKASLCLYDSLSIGTAFDSETTSGHLMTSTFSHLRP